MRQHVIAVTGAGTEDCAGDRLAAVEAAGEDVVAALGNSVLHGASGVDDAHDAHTSSSAAATTIAPATMRAVRP